ncbi:MAG: response regulator [Elusimicrobiales bacterium]|jgi:DNA-binding response OmpR family regulator|nr:response regulator [Elusimicrobiales bacterium]
MPIKLLIVDDDRNFIETLEDGLRLKQVDAEITVAKSAREGLDELAKAAPSLIILDVQLPDMHGIEFMKVIKDSARLKSVPIIFISAKYTEPADRAEAVLGGAAAFFSKPIDIEELWKEIRYLLDTKK